MKDFRLKLQRIARKNYSCYHDLLGGFRIGKSHYNLYFVQPDPFAPPSQMEVVVPFSETGLPTALLTDDLARTALCDFVHRRIFPAACEQSQKAGPSRSGGSIGMPKPSQQILDRTVVQIRGETVRIRFALVLPADQRSVAAEAASELLLNRVPEAVTVGVWWDDKANEEFALHLRTLRKARALRAQLEERGLVAFVADGSLLPRASGVSDEPAAGAVPFESPERWAVELEAEGERIRGMGIPEGLTLLVGGAFHGKSTLLRALEQGVYDHVPGDGREFAVARADAAKIRSEEGRWISGADLSLFAHDLPGGKDAADFSTEAASGATSQAAALVEALECGSRLLLIDEDESAVNFLFRDERMRALVDASRESIAPLVDRISFLKKSGVSVVMVAGAGGDVLDLADRAIALKEWRCEDVTDEAREVCAKLPARRGPGSGTASPELPLPRRAALPSWSATVFGKKGEPHAKAVSAGLLRLGSFEADLTKLDQLVDRAQTQALGAAVLWLAQNSEDGETVPELVARAEERVAKAGLDGLSRRSGAEFARFRPQELAAALYRLRRLGMRPGNRG
ncbi:MAG: ABC-ATPase domain-containing protein [Fibrobacterales bacterium]|nr:ABC-ATPase domain-containing protein [Fibrobacterales bacterium]